MIKILVFLLTVIPLHKSVTLHLDDFHEHTTYSLGSTLRDCIRREDADHVGNILMCLKEGALVGLTNVDERQCVEVLEGVTLLKDNEGGPLPRGLYSGGLLNAASEFIGRRYLKWDMNIIQPGLFMKVGPMLDSSGILEFVMEDDYPRYSDRTSGTGEEIPVILSFIH